MCSTGLFFSVSALFTLPRNVCSTNLFFTVSALRYVVFGGGLGDHLQTQH